MKNVKFFGGILIAFALVITACSKMSEPAPNANVQTVNESAVQELAAPTEEIAQDLLLLNCFDPEAADPTQPCFAVLDPVCACGTITFSNACEAERVGFVNTTKGACPLSACPSPALESIMSSTECAAVYQPVCGCDGETYSNACVALVSGVAIYTPGECGSLVE